MDVGNKVTFCIIEHMQKNKPFPILRKRLTFLVIDAKINNKE